MAAATSYRAEMTGLSERDRTMLRSLLAATQARTGLHWDGDASQPRIHFIDIDNPDGADFWQSLAESERRESTILLSQTEPAIDGARWLPKPLRSSALLNTLNQVSMRVGVKAVPAKPVAESNPRIEVPVGEPRLLEILDEAGVSTAQVLQSTYWPDIVLSSGNAYAMRTAPVENYVEGFARSLEVTNIAKYTGGPMSDDQRIELDALRWLAMLHAPLGEIAHRLPAPVLVRLRAMPEFSLLPHTLQHVRMAAWLTKHAASPEELADMVGVDEETVQRFLGACAAVNLMEEVAEVPAESTPIETSSVVEAPATEEPFVEVSLVAAAAPAVEPPAPGETLSVLERLRATREENRARVAAAIRGISNQ